MSAASPVPTPAATSWRIEAPAKLNLYLHVVGRRADGYHRLDSLIAFTETADRLEAHAADDLALALRGPMAAALAPDPDNLVLRAARALAGLAGIAPRARLVLTKNLPVASGIGGGSADAAASLRLLTRLWRLNPSATDLARLALELGADVPMCLSGQTAFAGGVGEDLTPAPTLPPVAVVLANPGVAVATPAVFRARSGPFSAPARFETALADAAVLAARLRERDNDLAAPARTLAPVIGEVEDALAAQAGCLLARMSGSGATCFGLFADPREAEAAARALGGAHPGWWVAATRLRQKPPQPEAWTPVADRGVFT